MHKISLAPVLSATLSRDSCWIISRSFSSSFSELSEAAHHMWCRDLRQVGSLLGLFEHGDQAPALGGAERAGLHDAHAVAHAGLVALVVGLQPDGLAQHLAVQAVLHPVLDRDDDRLVHLVADDEALPDLPSAPLEGSRDNRLRARLLGCWACLLGS